MCAFSASLLQAVGVSYFQRLEHKHADKGEVANKYTMYYSDNNVQTQICHAVPALLLSEFLHQPLSTTAVDLITGPRLLLTDINPSCPVDPPLHV